MIELFYLLSIFFVGAIISYEDWRKGIIKNKFLLILLIVGILYYSYNFSFIASNTSSFLWNIFWAMFVGMFLWFINIWPSGDAKLFIILSILLPTGVLLASWFPVMDFLINTFVPLFIVYIFMSFIKTKKKEIKEAFKFAFDPYKVFLVFLVLLGFIWFIMKGFSLIGIQPNVFIFVIMLFLMMEFVTRFLTFHLEVFYIILAIVRLIIDFRNVYTLHFAFEFFSILFIYLFFRFFILRLAFTINTESVKINDLEPGMRSAEGILKKQEEKKTMYEKIKLFHFDYIDFLFQKRKKFIHSVSDEGLSEKDVKKIKEMRAKGEFPFDEILIHKAIPFAIFLLLGFIVTILLKGNFITILKMFI